MASKSFVEFFISFGKSLAWPYADRPILAILMFAPFIGMLLVMVLKRGINATQNKFLIIFGIFIIGQAFAIALVRGGSGNSPVNRYLELLIFGPLINFTSLILLFKATQKWKFKKYFCWASSAWILIAVIGLGTQAQLVFSQGLISWQSQSNVARKNISNYLKTRDRNHLENKPSFQISHPSPESLINILEDEILRDLIPVNAEGTDSRLREGKLRPLTEGLMNAGQWILLLGIVLLMGTSIIGWVNRDRFP